MYVKWNWLIIFVFVDLIKLKQVLLHIDVNGGLLPTGSSSPDYIDQSLLLRNLTKRGLEVMLTITELIAVISLCVAFYSLGYVCGKHDAKIEK